VHSIDVNQMQEAQIARIESMEVPASFKRRRKDILLPPIASSKNNKESRHHVASPHMALRAGMLPPSLQKRFAHLLPAAADSGRLSKAQKCDHAAPFNVAAPPHGVATEHAAPSLLLPFADSKSEGVA
jgi:hypothetical protein